LQTQRWLDRHGFSHASVLVVPGSRGKLAAALNLDAVVDDVARYCLDVTEESRATPCLVWRRDESPLPPGVRRLGIEVFHSAGECLDYLVSRDVTVTTLAARIKTRLGFPPRISA
jgi:hypothetical protein